MMSMRVRRGGCPASFILHDHLISTALMTTVYVICPDDNQPTGGVLKLYDFVDILNNNQIDSYIIHDDKNFRATWFENKTKITSADTVFIKNDDLVVIPEIWAERVLTLWPGIRKIIFNQDSFNTFIPFRYKLAEVQHIYLHPDVVQVMVVSDYDYDALNWLFPGIQLRRIYHGINNKLFFFNQHKKKQIAFMPRKGTEDFIFLDYLLSLKNCLDDFKITVIDKMPLEQCANVLRESAIFLSFSHKEGFGLPPAEAMACGCIVIGYHGQGGKEFFKKNLTFSIEHSDLFSYAKQICYVIEQFKTNPLTTLQIGKQASDYIIKTYSLANQEKSILWAIQHLI